MILPDFEIKWDFGPDSSRLMEIIYMSSLLQYFILSEFKCKMMTERNVIKREIEELEARNKTKS